MKIDIIKENLKADIVGRDILFFDEVDSTNDLLFRLGEEAASDGTVVISEMQTKGRGRMNRSWFSPAGRNLYTSVLFRPDISVSESPVFTFIASLALMDSFESLGISPQIKWPNDIVYEGKKIAGVLTEMKPGKSFLVDFIVVGIGANLNMRYEDFKENEGVSGVATSAYEILGHEIEREKFAGSLLESLEQYYAVFLDEGVHSIVATWTNRWGCINRHIRIHTEGGTVEGVVKKVDRTGYLYLETPDGNLEKVIAGDTLF